jgi:transposase InsO family protein
MGVRKLYSIIEPFLYEHSIKMGRDALFKLMKIKQLLVVRKRSPHITTNSLHRFYKYPNLVEQYTPKAINTLWVSDITYWKMRNGYLYISLVTDAYSRKVVGYHVAKNLEAAGTVKAMAMALGTIKNKPLKLIHHSDRGTQYCCNEYIKLLKENNIQISMTANGDPYENALAERINGILKGEYLYQHRLKSIDQARKIMDLTIKLYNKERPHMSWGYKTPEAVHLDVEMLITP